MQVAVANSLFDCVNSADWFELLATSQWKQVPRSPLLSMCLVPETSRSPLNSKSQTE